MSGGEFWILKEFSSLNSMDQMFFKSTTVLQFSEAFSILKNCYYYYYYYYYYYHLKYLSLKSSKLRQARRPRSALTQAVTLIRSTFNDTAYIV